MTAGAAVAAEVGSLATREMHRRALQKGVWRKLLRPAQAYLPKEGLVDSTEGLPEERYRMHPIWEEAVCSLRFGNFGKARRVRQRREIQAALDLETEVGQRFSGTYFINLQDSQVSLAALLKSRSFSPSINNLLRGSIADYVLYQVRAFYGYVESAKNPSDDPTRGNAVRAPSRSPAPCGSLLCEWGAMRSSKGFCDRMERRVRRSLDFRLKKSFINAWKWSRSA